MKNQSGYWFHFKISSCTLSAMHLNTFLYCILGKDIDNSQSSEISCEKGDENSDYMMMMFVCKET